MKINNNKAIELIKIIYFYPKALKIFIDVKIKQLAIFGGNIPDEWSRDPVESILTSDKFLKPFAENIESIFTEEEIGSLLEIYQSKVMQKFLTHSEDFFAPLYEESGKLIENMIKS